MIEKLVVYRPTEELRRVGFESEELDRFVRATGIAHTWRTKLSTDELAVVVAKRCMRGYLSRKFSAVIVVTQTAVLRSPALAIEVARLCGISADVPCFDLNQSCTGFLYGLRVASAMATDDRPALLICVDKLRSANPGTGRGPPLEDLIFSDGACAAIVHNADLEWRFHADGHGRKSLWANESGVHMNGPEVFDFVTTKVPGLVKGYLQSSRFDPEFICQHQANISMMKLIDRRTGFIGRSLSSIEQYGNMSMVSIPMALAYNEDIILNKRVLLCGYGAGWSVALASIRWSAVHVAEIFGGVE